MKSQHNNLNSNSSVMVSWTRPLLEKFRVEYEAAIRAEKDTFLFNDHGYTVGYARYLIQFLDGDLA
jgi:hypothetical protein